MVNWRFEASSTRTVQTIIFGAAIGIAVGMFALASGDDEPTDSKGRLLRDIPPSTPLDSSQYETAIAVGETKVSDRLAQIIHTYNTGSANYLDLPLVVDDEFDPSDPPTLQMLIESSDVAFVARVSAIRWEKDPILRSMKVVTYEMPSYVAYGQMSASRKVHGRMTGPTAQNPPTYVILEFGVREEVGETYLVFSGRNHEFGFDSAPFNGGFIRIDGDRVANSEAAKALGIEGKKVSDVIAELRRLKGN